VLLALRAVSVSFASLVLLFSLESAGASAHAYIVKTAPVTNATVRTSPREVSISYDEPIEIESRAALVVRAADGTTYPCSGGAHLDPNDATRVVCTLLVQLQRGAYTVSWRVTSADTHVVHGNFSFGVAAAVHGRSDATASIYDPSGALAGVLRWLTLIGIAALLGALGFERFVLRARAFHVTAGGALALLRRNCRVLCSAGAALALLASLAALVVQAAAATGTDAVRALPSLSNVVFGSEWGAAWLVRVTLLCVILLLMRSRRLAPLALVAAALVPVSLSASGHAVASGHPAQSVVPVVADWIHLSAAALWSGGLAAFSFGLRPALAALALDERPAFVRKTIARFSRVASTAVAAIVASGVYAGILHVGSPATLFGSLYGRVILAKVLLLVPLLSIGYLHYRQGHGHASRLDFVTTVTGETAIAVAVLGLSALLTGLAPPYPNGEAS
jgi:copper transport protein